MSLSFLYHKSVYKTVCCDTLQLEFGVEPESLHFVPELSPVEGAMQTEQTVDSIRHIYLGRQPLVVKQCSR
jgi:mediator of RNA polymerase II transcription subunit 16